MNLPNNDSEYADADTMDKVYTALKNVGLTEGAIIRAVNDMQNAGILFRERA